MSGRIIFVTGGARSGKSTFAEAYVRKHAPGGALYVATAEAHDEEMQERIRLHQEDREKAHYSWETAECPRQLPAFLSSCEGKTVLVDCLTIWLSNELLALEQEADCDERLNQAIQELVDAASEYSGTLVFVSNEVGSGVVPAYKLGRVFRDAAGRLNQQIAKRAEEVYLVTAGIPMELKKRMVEL